MCFVIGASSWTSNNDGLTVDAASGPQQAPSVPSLPGQSSVPRPQAMSMFQPTFTWQFPPVSGEGRRTDINISLPGG